MPAGLRLKDKIIGLRQGCSLFQVSHSSAIAGPWEGGSIVKIT